jgi:CcmD family protein
MSNWTFIAAVPPLLIWFAIYVYLARIDGRLKALEKKIGP